MSPAAGPAAPVGFPAPSMSEVTAFPAAAPAPSAPRSPLEDDFQFEILDDDDEIIDLS